MFPPSAYTASDPAQTRHFVRGTPNRALGVGRALVALLDLGGRRRLLDIGGGPGTYAALFAQRHPDLTATVLDLPGVVAIAAELGVAERVATLAGDYHTTDFPDGQDVVLISGVLHRETPAQCQALIARAAAALVPGGLMVVSDLCIDDTGTAPDFAALFGLNMLLSAEVGGVHSEGAIAGWLSAADLTGVKRRPFPPPLPHRVVLGLAAGGREQRAGRQLTGPPAPVVPGRTAPDETHGARGPVCRRGRDRLRGFACRNTGRRQGPARQPSVQAPRRGWMPSRLS